MPIDDATRERIQAWLDGPFDTATKQEIQRLLREDPVALADAFFQDLSFGTGGMRSIMGVGTNRINIYTIRNATQGLANYILKQKIKNPSVFIGYDVREHSQEFAEETAKVLAGNKIKVWLTETFCPTPLVSFACRLFHCQAAIMITASHNPPQYNGYKVYWSDGGQVVPPHDLGIMEEVLKVKKVHLDPLDSKRIQRVGEVIDQAYLEKLHTLQITSPPAPLQIIYTNLHGTGIRIIPQALKSWGYNDVALVKAQSTPDGHFTHAPSPNPEEEKALKMGTDLLLKEQKDLLIATDPDADRVGIVIRHQNQPIRFTGHQIGSLCLNHICSSLQEKGRLPPFSIAIKTIVTTELFQKIARQYGVKCIDVLTGFKYIAQTIADLERVEPTSTFLFGAEESYGYLAGTFVRDKDAISTSCLIAEMTSKAKSQNKTLFNLLYELYEIHGVHREHLTNIKFADTQQGMRQMEQCIDRIRKEPPSLIGDTQVDHFEDYALAPVSHTHASKDGQSVTSDLPQECEKWGLKMGTLPQSNVLRFWLKDQTKIVIRPSGTEPKVKIYIEVVTTKGLPINQGIKACDEKLKYLEGIMNSFLSLGT